MAVNFEDKTPAACDGQSPSDALMSDVVAEPEFRALDLVLGLGAPQRVGRFRFFIEGQRWEWSDAVARMHGYQPDEVEPTTDLLLQHKHPEDRDRVAAILDQVRNGIPSAVGNPHRCGWTHHCVVVAGDRWLTTTVL